MSHHMPLADYAFITKFAAFCRGKPVDEGYDFMSVTNCVGAQFIRSQEPTFAEFGSAGWEDTNGEWHDVPYLGCQLVADPQTFSALAGRLEALLIAEVTCA